MLVSENNAYLDDPFLSLSRTSYSANPLWSLQLIRWPLVTGVDALALLPGDALEPGELMPLADRTADRGGGPGPPSNTLVSADMRSSRMAPAGCLLLGPPDLPVTWLDADWAAPRPGASLSDEPIESSMIGDRPPGPPLPPPREAIAGSARSLDDVGVRGCGDPRAPSVAGTRDRLEADGGPVPVLLELRLSRES